ncbi:MAG: AbrB/MazE/SpoVT family DNA-binding domain-containing protein [Cyanobacteria bacterium QH_9_48_43]|nr:MAG: AbrB/MazE/SpoVT family DNA-binding domain-containing protein [Cyanobacteria bacterium QH_9_48_43]
MTATITKWGNSLAVRIPKHLAEEANLQEGTQVSIWLSDGKIAIAPKRKKYSLEELLEGISPEDSEGEIDWGSPVGEEVW